MVCLPPPAATSPSVDEVTTAVPLKHLGASALASAMAIVVAILAVKGQDVQSMRSNRPYQTVGLQKHWPFLVKGVM